MTEELSAAGAERSVNVLLSYARVDRVRATKLAAALQATGLTVWWDVMIDHRAHPGRS